MTSPHRFDMGQVVMTRTFKDKAEGAHGPVGTLARIEKIIRRHGAGDWGDLTQEDMILNNQALKDGDRLFSAYETEFDFKVWVITEADRSSTTILLPEDY